MILLILFDDCQQSQNNYYSIQISFCSIFKLRLNKWYNVNKYHLMLLNNVSLYANFIE